VELYLHSRYTPLWRGQGKLLLQFCMKLKFYVLLVYFIYIFPYDARFQINSCKFRKQQNVNYQLQGTGDEYVQPAANRIQIRDPHPTPVPHESLNNLLRKDNTSSLFVVNLRRPIPFNLLHSIKWYAGV